VYSRACLELCHVAARVFVVDFFDTMKHGSFARLPGIRPLTNGG